MNAPLGVEREAVPLDQHSEQGNGKVRRMVT